MTLPSLFRPAPLTFSFAAALLLSALIATFATASARAADPAPAAAPAEKAASAEIEALVQKGNDLRRSGDDQGALPLLQKAYGLAPTARNAVQLGLAEQAMGRWADADLHLTTGLKVKDDPWIKRNRSAIEDALARVKNNVGRVEITGDPAGAEVLVAGRLVGHVPLSEPVRVSAGSVDIELRAPGYQPLLRTVTIAGGQYQPVVMRLEKVGAPGLAVAANASSTTAAISPAARLDAQVGTPAATSARVWIERAAIAATVAGIGVGIYGAVAHGNLVNDFNDRHCIETSEGSFVLSNGEQDAECGHLADRYDGARTLEIAGFVAAGAFAVTAAVLHFTDDARDGRSASVRTRCAPAVTGPGIVCAATF